MMLEKVKKKKYLIVSFVLIYIGIYFLCRYNLFAQDEYNYRHIAWTDQKIASFGDVIKSQMSVYQLWSGRVLVLGMVQIFLYIGKFLYDWINPLIVLLFIIFIQKIAISKVTGKGNFFVLFLMLFGSYQFWEKYIWLSGSLNYLWTVMMMLVVIYELDQLVLKNKKIGKFQTVFLWIASFLAGWSHENTVFVLGSFYLFLGWFQRKKIVRAKVDLKIKLIVSFALFGIGAILLIFCPGNFARMSGMSRSFCLLPVLKNIAALYKVILLYIGSVIYLKSKKLGKEMLQDQLRYYIFPILLALTPMIFLSEFPIRAALAYEVMLYIMLLQNSNLIVKMNQKWQKKGKLIFGSILMVISLFLLYSKVIFSVVCLRPYQEKIEMQIKSEKAKGKKDLVISMFEHPRLAKWMGVYMHIFPENVDIAILNTYMSTYYEVDTITAVKDHFVQIEVGIGVEEKLEDYEMVDQNTKEIVAKRIKNAKLCMPNIDLKGRILFEVPIEKLEETFIVLPEIVQKNVTYVKIKSTSLINREKMSHLLDL